MKRPDRKRATLTYVSREINMRKNLHKNRTRIYRRLTDSRAFSTLNTSSDNKWKVPVFPRCLANAAAHAE